MVEIPSPNTIQNTKTSMRLLSLQLKMNDSFVLVVILAVILHRYNVDHGYIWLTAVCTVVLNEVSKTRRLKMHLLTDSNGLNESLILEAS